MREGWEYEKLGKLCKTGAGGTPLKSKKDYYVGGNIPFLRSGEVNNRNIVDCELRITEKGLNNSSAKLFPPSTVLIAMYGATAGQVGILNFECSTNQAVCGIFPNELFITEFLYYRFLAGQDELIKQAVGGAQPNISQVKIKNTLIPKITLQEQKEIVALLDKAFAAIDKAKANIEKNIKNAKELFKAKKEFLFNGLIEKCKVLPIESVCVQIFAGGDAPKGNFSRERTKEYNVPIIANAVKNNGLYGYTDKARVLDASITIAARGSGTGHTEIRDYPFFPIVRLIVLTPDTSIVNAEFLMHAIKNLIIERSGSAIPQLTIPMMKGYSVPVPIMGKQEEVNKELCEIQAKLDEYKVRLTKKSQQLEELKKSLLQKAFAGELTSANSIEIKQLTL